MTLEKSKVAGRQFRQCANHADERVELAAGEWEHEFTRAKPNSYRAISIASHGFPCLFMAVRLSVEKLLRENTPVTDGALVGHHAARSQTAH